MKFSLVAVFALVATASAFAPSTVNNNNKASRGAVVSSLHAHSPDHKQTPWWGAAATAFAGLTLAGQIASASIPANVDSYHQQDTYFAGQTTTTLSAFGGVETLDFSLPSYEAATKGDDIATPKGGGAPSFNPFGDFVPDFKTDSPAPAPAPEPAPVVEEAGPTKAELKAAADAKKAEEKAAAEAKKAEEKAAAEAKKAEKAARLAAEKEKQKAAVERSKEEDSGPAISMPDIKMPEFKAPDIPEFKAPEIPEFKAPDIKMPAFYQDLGSKANELKSSDFKAPEIKAPEIPEFKAPDVKLPSFSMPKFDIPDMPKFEVPDMPSAPSGGGGGGGAPKVDIPKFDAPDISVPKVELPKVSLPSFGGGGGGDSGAKKAEAPKVVGSQEDRDEAAREARKVFLAADEEAKAAEEAARQVREAANGKKKLAKAAKDLACETRPGGKLLCLRNPFSSGY